jgi:hypothetical protein
MALSPVLPISTARAMGAEHTEPEANLNNALPRRPSGLREWLPGTAGIQDHHSA